MKRQGGRQTWDTFCQRHLESRDKILLNLVWDGVLFFFFFNSLFTSASHWSCAGRQPRVRKDSYCSIYILKNTERLIQILVHTKASNSYQTVSLHSRKSESTSLQSHKQSLQLITHAICCLGPHRISAVRFNWRRSPGGLAGVHAYKLYNSVSRYREGWL